MDYLRCSLTLFLLFICFDLDSKTHQFTIETPKKFYKPYTVQPYIDSVTTVIAELKPKQKIVQKYYDPKEDFIEKIGIQVAKTYIEEYKFSSMGTAWALSQLVIESGYNNSKSLNYSYSHNNYWGLTSSNGLMRFNSYGEGLKCWERSMKKYHKELWNLLKEDYFDRSQVNKANRYYNPVNKKYGSYNFDNAKPTVKRFIAVIDKLIEKNPDENYIHLKSKLEKIEKDVEETYLIANL